MSNGDKSTSAPSSETPRAGTADNINIEHLANLAKLALSPDETVAVRTDLTNIMRMIDEMQALETTGVPPLAHPLESPARLRADEVTEQVERDRYQQIAPSTDQGYYLVPKVIESA